MCVTVRNSKYVCVCVCVCVEVESSLFKRGRERERRWKDCTRETDAELTEQRRVLLTSFFQITLNHMSIIVHNKYSLNAFMALNAFHRLSITELVISLSLSNFRFFSKRERNRKKNSVFDRRSCEYYVVGGDIVSEDDDERIQDEKMDDSRIFVVVCVLLLLTLVYTQNFEKNFIIDVENR